MEATKIKKILEEVMYERALMFTTEMTIEDAVEYITIAGDHYIKDNSEDGICEGVDKYLDDTMDNYPEMLAYNGRFKKTKKSGYKAFMYNKTIESHFTVICLTLESLDKYITNYDRQCYHLNGFAGPVELTQEELEKAI